MNTGGSQDHDQESINQSATDGGRGCVGGEGQHLGKGAQLLSKQDRAKTKQKNTANNTQSHFTFHNSNVCLRRLKTTQPQLGEKKKKPKHSNICLNSVLNILMRCVKMTLLPSSSPD